MRECLSSSLLWLLRAQNQLIPRHRHFVAAVPPAWRAARPSVGYRSSWYRGKCVRAAWPARPHRRDIGPGSCGQMYAAMYGHSFASAPILVPRHLAPAHRSSAASPRSKADLFSGFATVASLQCQTFGAAKRPRPLSPSGRSSNEGPPHKSR